MCRPGRRGSVGFALLASLATAAVCAAPAPAAFPVAANGDVAYHRYESQFDVFKMSATGAGQVNLTNTPTGYDVSPSYSPDGRRIVFIRQAGGHNDVFVMGADGSAPVDLTNTPGLDETSPVFSPDGRTIAYTSDDQVPGPVDLHLMKADGSGQHVLISTAGTERAPDFSPDGMKILFESCLGGNCDIYTIAPDGSGLTNVSNTPAPTSEGDPAFSPDGRRIVLARTLGIAMGGLGVMNADGTGASNITLSNSPENAPSFSPDGRLIIYSARPPGDGTTDVLTRNADGSNPVNLTNTFGLREESPAWEWDFVCGGRPATIVGTDSGEKLKGTKGADVIVANGGNDRIKGLGGSDRICGGAGRDRVAGGKGRRDLCRGQAGKDYGGKGCEKGKL
jgi:Tol biopolymer transport system component